jgi:membrane protein DedA with SNARE-associated domain
MDALIGHIGLFIDSHSAWAGPITALLTLGESLLVVGLFVPATALMLVTGGLIAAGIVEAPVILAWGIAGAVVGDFISYGIGRWAGPGVVRRWPLNRQRRAVARARLFFSRYGFASVLLGRFLGPLRCLVPTVAGIMGMSHARFQAANVLSAVLWMPAMLAPGYLAGISLQEMTEGSSSTAMYAGAGLSTLLGIWLLVAVMRNKRREPAALRRARSN